MIPRFRISSLAWILAPVCALAFIIWTDRLRLERVEFVSNFATKDAQIDARSPTGYADGKRWLIVPEHNNPTYQWIEETQLMLARGDWRVRNIDYENAPFGRSVYSASPYRWWLVLVAWVGHEFSGMPLELCVERAALLADPLLHLALLVGGTVFVVRRFGRFCAAMFSLGVAAIFPLAAAYLPGVANDYGMEQILVLWSVLLLVAGTLAGRHASRWYLAAGVAGGCGLWLSAMGEFPIIVGIAIGGILAALVTCGSAEESSVEASALPPWRAWALGGAISSFLAYLVEYFPGHMEAQLKVNYPLYALAWLGLGELLCRFSSWARGTRPTGGMRGVFTTILSAAAFASLPVAMLWARDGGFLADDLLSARLSNLPDGVEAADMAAWIARDGLGAALAAVVLPLLLVGSSAWLLLRKRTGSTHRRAIAVALGPVIVVLAIATIRLRWWNSFDIVLLVLLVAATAAVHTAANPQRARWLWSALVGVVLAFGLVQLVPEAETSGSGVIRLTRSEVEGLYERALSHWIADRAGPDGATVLTPALRTSSFCFYGGLRGIATQNWENRHAMSSTFQIFTSVHSDESELVIRQRGVTHIVLPQWDTALEDYARSKLKYMEASFIYALRPPFRGGFSWLRPLPYKVPPVAGLEEASVLVLHVTDEADPATAQSRLVEYHIEMHNVDQAALESQALQRYSTDIGSLVARAQLAKAQGSEADFSRVFKLILIDLSRGTDRSLIWDRRVSLAVALALGGRYDLSREQVRRCVEVINDERIRSLTTESLYHLLLLGKRYGIAIADPSLRALSLNLLPEKLRDRF